MLPSSRALGFLTRHRQDAQVVRAVLEVFRGFDPGQGFNVHHRDPFVVNGASAVKVSVLNSSGIGTMGVLFVLGDEHADPKGLDFPSLRMRVYKNGEFLSEGLGSAALDSPLNCVSWLANTLSKFGITLDAGDVVLSGSLVPLEPVVAGDEMRLEVEGIGTASVQFT